MSDRANNNNKIKLLLFGSSSTPATVHALIRKCQSLHGSKAGPFDAAFIVGPSHVGTLIQQVIATESASSLPNIYVHDASATNRAGVKLMSVSGDEPPKSTDEPMKANLCQLAPKLYLLRDAFANNQGGGDDDSSTKTQDDPDATVGIWRLTVAPGKPPLVVAACPTHVRIPDPAKVKNISNKNSSSVFWKTLQHASYRGCDLLLSAEWPQGIEACLPSPSNETQQQLQSTSSYDVAAIALQARARYHVVSSSSSSPASGISTVLMSSLFVQSHPFHHIAPITATAAITSGSHTGRFISLAPVTSDVVVAANNNTSSSSKLKQPNSKLHKFVHALGLVPLEFARGDGLDSTTSSANVGVVLPNPFTDASYHSSTLPSGPSSRQQQQKQQHGSLIVASNIAPTTTFSEAAARRILAEERAQSVGMSGLPSERWQQYGTKRRRAGDDSDQCRYDHQPSDPTTTTPAVSMVDPSCRTLFVHGLHKDVTGRLQQSKPGDDMLLQEAFPQAKSITRPGQLGSGGGGGSNNTPNIRTSFCFVEFDSHDAAAQCLYETAGHVQVAGVALIVKWKTSSSQQQQQQQRDQGRRGMTEQAHAPYPDAKRSRFLTEAEARYSSSLYFKLPRSIMLQENPAESVAFVGEAIRQWMEQTLEEALADGSSSSSSSSNKAIRHNDEKNNDNDTSSSSKVSAASEPALRVQLRLPSSNDGMDRTNMTTNVDEGAASVTGTARSFGFLDFASHAAASMALATLTGSIEGGMVQTDAPGLPKKALNMTQDDKEKPSNSNIALDDDDNWRSVDNRDTRMYLHWALPKKAEPLERNVIVNEASGFRFERKHFPSDGRQDCWFCLASPSCERQLIVGVYDKVYAAMPKGPVHAGHVLLIPVQHDPNNRGVLTMADTGIATEIEQLKKQIRHHVSTEYQMDMFIFERAIPTKGGYHTHVQCIPIDTGLGPKLQRTMMAQAMKCGMQLQELQTDLALSTVLKDDENHSDAYFYAEIPISASSYKRFLHKSSHDGLAGSRSQSFVPLQFGREVLAAVLEKPDIAHWKSCLKSAEDELAMATMLRDSLARYTATDSANNT